MQIIAGSARRIKLNTPPTLEVRPTAGRAREALFSALGDLSGAEIVDLCAGSGALGLEAASRGAGRVTFVELAREHIRYIQENIVRVQKAGCKSEFKVLAGDAGGGNWCQGESPDIIFSDPPYAESARIFRKLLSNDNFLRYAAGSLLIWEIPDYKGALGEFIGEGFPYNEIRKFGG
ncbi:MAG: RsmD family RNA methyltransferase, partial [Victivallaceae bacterium]